MALPAGFFTTVEHGSNVAGIKKRATPKQWRRVVRRAHARGETVAGYLSGQPAYLRERTRSSITNQAKSLISESYAPAEAALSSREARITAIQDKRRADGEAFRTWLANQHAVINAEVQRQRTQLATEAQASRDSLQASLVGMGDVPHAAGAPDVAGSAKQGAALAAGARGEAITQQNTIYGDRLAATQANNFAFLAAQQAAAAADTWEKLMDVADDKQKIALQKGADQAKLIQDLLQGEVTKAQSNREFGAALQELGIKEQSLQADIQDKNTKNALARDKYNLDVAALDETRQYHQDTIAEREAARKQKAAGKGDKIDREVYEKVRTIKRYADQKLGSPDRVRRRARRQGEPAMVKFRKFWRNLPPDLQAYSLAAYDLWRYGKLRSGGRAELRQAGVPIPKGW
jgi:hypothetical protein